jgi:hypothetical protein
VACPFGRLVFTPYPLLSTPIRMTRTLPGFGERNQPHGAFKAPRRYETQPVDLGPNTPQGCAQWAQTNRPSPWSSPTSPPRPRPQHTTRMRPVGPDRSPHPLPPPTPQWSTLRPPKEYTPPHKHPLSSHPDPHQRHQGVTPPQHGACLGRRYPHCKLTLLR